MHRSDILWIIPAALTLLLVLLRLFGRPLAYYTYRKSLLVWAGLSVKERILLHANHEPLQGFLFKGVEVRSRWLAEEAARLDDELALKFLYTSKRFDGFEQACVLFMQEHMDGVSDTILSHHRLALFKATAATLYKTLRARRETSLSRKLWWWIFELEKWERTSCLFFSGKLEELHR